MDIYFRASYCILSPKRASSCILSIKHDGSLYFAIFFAFHVSPTFSTLHTLITFYSKLNYDLLRQNI